MQAKLTKVYIKKKKTTLSNLFILNRRKSGNIPKRGSQGSTATWRQRPVSALQPGLPPALGSQPHLNHMPPRALSRHGPCSKSLLVHWQRRVFLPQGLLTRGQAQAVPGSTSSPSYQSRNKSVLPETAKIQTGADTPLMPPMEAASHILLKKLVSSEDGRRLVMLTGILKLPAIAKPKSEPQRLSLLWNCFCFLGLYQIELLYPRTVPLCTELHT